MHANLLCCSVMAAMPRVVDDVTGGRSDHEADNLTTNPFAPLIPLDFKYVLKCSHLERQTFKPKF